MIFEALRFIKLAPDGTAPTTYSLSAGTSDVNTTPVDLRAHQGQEIAFIVDLGPIAAGGGVTIKAQSSPDGVTYTDIAGTSQTSADTNDDMRLGLQLNRCMQPFVRLNIARADGGNATINQVEAIIGKLRVGGPGNQLTSAGQFIRQPEIFGSSQTGTA